MDDAAIVPYCLLWGLIFIKREIFGNPSPLPDWYEATMPSVHDLQRGHPVHDPGLFPTVQEIRLELLDPDAEETPMAYSWCIMRSRCGSSTGSLNFDLPAIIKVLIAFCVPTLATELGPDPGAAANSGSQQVL